jgi:hypothetical protein
MGTERTRLIVLGVVAFMLLIAATWVLDWFVIDMPMAKMMIRLDTLKVCAEQICVETSDAPMRGIYMTMAVMAKWKMTALAALVAVQVGTRVLTGAANPQISRTGYFLGIAAFLSALAASFLFGPDPGTQSVGGLSPFGLETGIEITRSWTPTVALLAIALGLAALYYAIAHEDTAAIPDPVLPPVARVVTSRVPVARDGALPEAAPTPRPRTTGMIPIHPLRGKVRFAVVTAELTRGGVDARREDGTTILVVWRDVVGVVVRRLPAAYDGATVVDLVSSAGSTLRFVPWSRITGDVLVEQDPELRVRALVQIVAQHCPEAKLDPATRTFVDGHAPAAQLPDLETLAKHDDRLA